MRNIRPHRSKETPLRWWRIEATAQLPLAPSRKTKRAEAQGCYVRHLSNKGTEHVFLKTKTMKRRDGHCPCVAKTASWRRSSGRVDKNHRKTQRQRNRVS